MNRGPQLAVAWALVVGIGAAVAFAGGHSLGHERAAKKVRVLAERASQHRQSLAADLQLAAARARVERRLDATYRRFGRTQARLMALDVLAGRLEQRLARDASAAAKVTGLAELEPDPFIPTEPTASPGPTALSGASPRAVELDEELARIEKLLEDRSRALRVLESVLDSRSFAERVLLSSGPVTAAYVSSCFGTCIDPFTGASARREETDFTSALGTRVVTAASGVVTSAAGPRGDYGRMIELDHGNEFVTRYVHDAANLVTLGDVVAQGHNVVRLGEELRTTGPILHFEVLRGGRAVDPRALVE